MPTVEVYELQGLGDHSLRQLPLIAKQLVTFTSTQVVSAAFNRGTSAVTLLSTSAFRFDIAASPSSTNGRHVYVPAETMFDCTVIAGQKIACFSTTTTST